MDIQKNVSISVVCIRNQCATEIEKNQNIQVEKKDIDIIPTDTYNLIIHQWRFLLFFPCDIIYIFVIKVVNRSIERATE